jgi:hypothetical protein
VILWPAGLALAIVWNVFRDPAIDHRLVVVGALLPDVIDGPTGGVWVAHSLTASVALLVFVMLGTRHRRHARRRLLALPIGTFLHLLLDGMWTRTHAFWWPLLGSGLGSRLPALDHGVAVLVLEELAGTVALVWFWQRFALGRVENRTRFLRTGRVVAGSRPTPC